MNEKAMNEKAMAERLLLERAEREPVSEVTASMVAGVLERMRATGRTDEQIRERMTARLAVHKRLGDIPAAVRVLRFLAAHDKDMEERGRRLEKGEAPQEQAPVAVAREGMPPGEKGYTPVAGSKPYPVRHARAALEAGGVELWDGQEFPVQVSGRDEQMVFVNVMHYRGPGSRPPEGLARDRWECRRAQVVVALVNGGLFDLETSPTGVWAKVARPRGAATLAVVAQAQHGEQGVDAAVSFPQYPTITGWVMRRECGPGDKVPVTPWMHHPESGVDRGTMARDAVAAVGSLADYFGLMRPLRVVYE